MLIERRRPLAAVAAALVTTMMLVWLDGALGIERLQAALVGT
jgi:hypothetical protein